MTSSTQDKANEERGESNQEEYFSPLTGSFTHHSTHFVKKIEPVNAATPLSSIVSSSIEEQDVRYKRPFLDQSIMEIRLFTLRSIYTLKLFISITLIFQK